MDVRIYQPTKTAMQSGRGNTKRWLLRFCSQDRLDRESVMGWVSGADTRRQLKLFFEDKEAAIAYAERKGLSYEVIEPRRSKVHLQAYADNFKS